MPRWQRAYFAVCTAIAGFAIAYVMCDYAQWPRLTYFPVEREWRFVAGYPGRVPMAYVGTVLWGVGGAMLGAASAWIATRFIDRELSRRWTNLFGAWALAAFAYAGVYYTWSLWPF